jgi:four helix bundle protein
MSDPSKKFRFRNFKLYKDARAFSIKVKKITKEKFPDEERFGLTSQLWRALDSIILNTAEGSDRGTDKDFALFLNHAHTSLNEVVACFDVALDCEYINKEEQAGLLNDAAGLADQFTAFRNSLLISPTK